MTDQEKLAKLDELKLQLANQQIYGLKLSIMGWEHKLGLLMMAGEPMEEPIPSQFESPKDYFHAHHVYADRKSRDIGFAQRIDKLTADYCKKFDTAPQ